MAKGNRLDLNDDKEALLSDDGLPRSWTRPRSSLLDCYSFLKFTVIALLALALINALPYLQWNRKCADSLEKAAVIDKGERSLTCP